MMKSLLAIILVSGSLLSGNAYAATAEEQGLAIAKETERRDSGFSDYVGRAEMILHNTNGDEKHFFFAMKVLEVKDDGDKSLAVFEQPADVAGTAILTYSHGRQPDDQWLYLPALKRVKRIASNNKSGPFLGSEYAYEDLATWEVDRFTYRYLRDETLEGRPSFVVENTPAYEYSGYARQEEWVDKERYQPNKIVFYDLKGALLKTMWFKDYHQYLGRHWRAHEMIVENHQTGKSTRLVWNDYRFRTGLKERDFSAQTLARVR